jgi:hypothetical protein
MPMNSSDPKLEASTGRIERNLRFYDFYIWLNLVWYVCILFLGVSAIRVQLPPEEFPPAVVATMRGGGFILCLIGIVCFILSLKLKNPERTKSGWTIAFMNICFGISTCILAPFCIFLALEWNREEFKREFIQEKFEL